MSRTLSTIPLMSILVVACAGPPTRTAQSVGTKTSALAYIEEDSPYQSTGVIGAADGTLHGQGDLVLVFEEEFECSGGEKRCQPDSLVWRKAIDSAGDLNQTLQANTARAENVFVEGGMLHLVARKELYIQKEGWKGAGASRDPIPDVGVPELLTLRPFTSGRVDTMTKLNFDFGRPGRIDVRVIVPNQRGIWPSAWMFVTDTSFHPPFWSATGELDIVELFGKQRADWNGIFTNLFWGGGYPFAAMGLGADLQFEIDHAVPHTYSVAWDSEGISFLIDGIVSTAYARDTIRARFDKDSVGNVWGDLTKDLKPVLEELDRDTYFYIFTFLLSDEGFVHWVLNDNLWGEVDDLLELDATPYAGFYSENRFPILWGGPTRTNANGEIEAFPVRRRHPAPFDHNGWVLQLQINVGGHPFGPSYQFWDFHALRTRINEEFRANFEGVVTRDELERRGITVPEVPQDIPDRVEMLVDSVRYYRLPDDAETGKIKICHHEGVKKAKGEMLIAPAEFRSHLKHGDYFGTCRDKYVVGPWPSN